MSPLLFLFRIDKAHYMQINLHIETKDQQPSQVERS